MENKLKVRQWSVNKIYYTYTAVIMFNHFRLLSRFASIYLWYSVLPVSIANNFNCKDTSCMLLDNWEITFLSHFSFFFFSFSGLVSISLFLAGRLLLFCCMKSYFFKTKYPFMVPEKNTKVEIKDTGLVTNIYGSFGKQIKIILIPYCIEICFFHK